MTDYYCLPFSSHPQRDQLYDELHARPFHPIATPQQITHLAFTGTPQELDRAFVLLCELCRRYGVAQPAAGSVSFLHDFRVFFLRWERHLEFYTLTIMRPAPRHERPFESRVVDVLPEDWLAEVPGQAVAALHLAVGDEDLDVSPEELERVFDGERLVMSRPKEGRALLCTAFRLHGDGFGRILIKNGGVSDYQMGRLVQRVYEMETYRLLAQLPMPAAKRLGPELHAMDRQLAQMLARLPDLDNSSDERDLLERLSLLSTRLESWRAETNYRFSATGAYQDLVLARLKNIREEEVEGHMTVAEFIARRLNPGLRSIEWVQSWMEDLSRRIERAGDLLRTRVNVTLQEQNKGLLAAMNHRSYLQLRMQETVEGLSVAAISYYMVGLIGYVLGGVPLSSLHLDKKTAMAVVVPMVLVSVWWTVRQIKHRLIRSSDGAMGVCAESESGKP